jgi:hypothetical protein
MAEPLPAGDGFISSEHNPVSPPPLEVVLVLPVLTVPPPNADEYPEKLSPPLPPTPPPAALPPLLVLLVLLLLVLLLRHRHRAQCLQHLTRGMRSESAEYLSTPLSA